MTPYAREFFNKFPIDLKAEAKRRWPTGVPDFTLCDEIYAGLTGYAAILRSELDAKEVDAYIKQDSNTALARTILSLQATVKRLQATNLTLWELRQRMVDFMDEEAKA